MKKMLTKFITMRGGSMLAALALIVTTASANSACMLVMHQPELPESARKLRKF